MSLGMFAYGFGMGTFKYLFAHLLMVAAYRGLGIYDYGFIDIFVPTYVGAVSAMAIFYFGSEYFLKRSNAKQAAASKAAIAKGVLYEPKKKFTRVNKALVKIRMTFGIYPFTFLAPLFLSIPLGSIVCAKFFGHKNKTFPLMLIFMAIYGIGMSLLMIKFND